MAQPKQKALDEQLNTAKQKECNEQKKFYDNQMASGNCSAEFTLADWPCTREGIGKRWEETKSEPQFLTRLDEEISMGYSMHQCGENLKGVRVILVKQSTTDSTASTSIRSVSLPLASGILNINKSIDSLQSGICKEIVINYWNYMSGGNLPAPREVNGEITWELQRNTGPVTMSGQPVADTEPASVKFYTDAQCSGEGKEKMPVTVLKGKDAATVYAKSSGKNSFVSIFVSSPDQGVTPKKPQTVLQ